jgi:NAD(P)-dependent dehydrogenase (short-subunit alcohol dehydrogenase family)
MEQAAGLALGNIGPAGTTAEGATPEMQLPQGHTVTVPSQDLNGRVAIVTGAGRGMGRAEAIDFARRGAKVAILDIDGPAARSTGEQIGISGGEAIVVEGDVAEPGVAPAAVAKVADTWGRLDIVVSNAGLIHSGVRISDTTDEEWRRTFAVHIDGAFHLVRAALPYLKASPAGRIILISSMWGQAGPGHSHAYCAAKGALIAFAKNLAKELGPDGICVNAVAPGGVLTRMAEAQTTAEYEQDLASIPVGRYAAPEEIAPLVSFLASDAAAFMTGQTIPINGGQLIGGF